MDRFFMNIEMVKRKSNLTNYIMWALFYNKMVLSFERSWKLSTQSIFSDQIWCFDRFVPYSKTLKSLLKIMFCANSMVLDKMKIVCIICRTYYTWNVWNSVLMKTISFTEDWCWFFCFSKPGFWEARKIVTH